MDCCFVWMGAARWNRGSDLLDWLLGVVVDGVIIFECYAIIFGFVTWRPSSGDGRQMAAAPERAVAVARVELKRLNFGVVVVVVVVVAVLLKWRRFWIPILEPDRRWLCRRPADGAAAAGVKGRRFGFAALNGLDGLYWVIRIHSIQSKGLDGLYRVS